MNGKRLKKSYTHIHTHTHMYMNNPMEPTPKDHLKIVH